MMSPKQLLREAQQKGISTLALTDINNTSGISEFFMYASDYKIKPVAGIDFRDGSTQRFVGIAKNMEGYKELNDFLSMHLQHRLEFNDRPPDFDNAFIIYPFNTYPSTLKPNEYIGINTSELNKLKFSGIRNLHSKLVILQPVTFLEKDTREVNGRTVTFRKEHIYKAHKLLRAMYGNTLLSKINADEFADEHEVMLPEETIRRVFSDYPHVIGNTIQLLNQCFIDFETGKNKNKKVFYGSSAEDRERLLQECAKGMQYRYQNPDSKIIERYEKEIEVITEMEFTAYFLINWDIVRHARHRNFFYVGRGSGANSMVAYLLRITDVDPIDLDLYFERFINPSRKNPPDFDIDFSSFERDEIIKYIFDKHGYDHTALLATYSTLQDNAVLRELGKVYGLPKSEIDSLPELEEGEFKKDSIIQRILAYGNYLKDFPSHLSIHAGGILISEKPIHYYTATVLPPKNFPLTQFSMLEAEDLGLYKLDILAQRGLGKVKDAVEIVKQNRGIDIDIHDIKRFKEDKDVSRNLETANLNSMIYPNTFFSFFFDL